MSNNKQSMKLYTEEHLKIFYHLEGCKYAADYQHGPSIHWGFRHWMWTLCGVSLFIWNVIELFPKSWKS